ncbi:hypothetical protein [Microbacterium sp. XT11]|uniref:hypothetical protein n=1 Tax=Microbacterium sp. XT11 TaxID=367477 RepID=UPI000743077C|nr:hypothetical protein [Microbacterium sp. XT11]ALX67446.1 hypothetical protein AB663_003398 [Microbacterium sp. XT11]
MTSPRTLPIPRPTLPAHEHAWLVESRHATSDGVVLYVRCAACGTRRVDIQAHPLAPPAALSRTVADESDGRRP